MKDLHHKTVKSLLISVFFTCSFNSIASEVSNSQVSTAPATDAKCSNVSDASTLCTQYLRGYLDALQQLSQAEHGTNASSFEDRAFRTRVGMTNRTPSPTDSMDVCLPSEISDSELIKILASRSKELPMEIAVLKVIQAKYPC